MKRITKITALILAILAGLFICLWLVFRIPSVQTRLVGLATGMISKSLKTEVSVKRVDITPFNRYLIEGVLVRDLKKDTLIYAGSVSIKITDWFFLKDDITLEYIGLNNTYIHTSRTDSVWNYNFIAKSLGGNKKASKESSGQIHFDLQDLQLNDIKFFIEDRWRGENQTIHLDKLTLNASEINLEKKKISLNEIEITKPVFSIYRYDALRPDSLKPKTIPKVDGQLYWNPAKWEITANKIKIKSGIFKSDLKTERLPYKYFDGAHLQFNGIDGQIENLSYNNDSIEAKLDLKTIERSGFEVNSLKALLHMDPTVMAFSELDIITPNSRLGNYFAMHYNYLTDDMPAFITNIKMHGKLINSKIATKDLAFFAPQLQNANTEFSATGEVTGTVDDLNASSLTLKTGNNSSISGNLKIKGLPDTDNTDYQLDQAVIRTTVQDINKIIPGLSKIVPIDLTALQAINFTGQIHAKGFDIETKGLTTTALGKINASLSLFHLGKDDFNYKIAGDVIEFETGKLLDVAGWGKTSFNFDVGQNTGQAVVFKSSDLTTDFNGYRYNHINLAGTFLNKKLEASLKIDDPILKAEINTDISLDSILPVTLIEAVVHDADLQMMKLSKSPLQFTGKTSIALKGNNADNLTGTASFNDLSLFRGNQVFIFDSIQLKAAISDSSKIWTLVGKDIDAKIQGKFEFAALKSTFSQYFSNYYPTYIKRLPPPKNTQDFQFNFEMKNAASILNILDLGLSGMNYSKVEGRINTENGLFKFDATIPKLIYKKLAVYDFRLNASGDQDSLRLFSKTSSIVFNDSLFFPNNEIYIRSSKDVSTIDVNTFSEQSQYGAKLSASLYNLTGGIKIHFNPSSLVFNEKTWNIEKDGEVILTRARLDANNFKISNGDQSISLLTLPAEANRLQTIILTLTKVNLGDLIPFVLKTPRIQGITTGDLTIEDPYNDFKLYLNAQTEKTRIEEDSIGLTSINAFWDQREKRASFFLDSENPMYQLDVRGKLNLKDSISKELETDINIRNVSLSLLKPYLALVFSDLSGIANGKLKISGDPYKPVMTGDVKVKNAKIKIAYTQCTYSIVDPEIRFLPGKIDFGNISLRDSLGNFASLKGSLEHDFFKNFRYNINASSRKILVLNTKREDNSIFYGNAIGRFNFNLNGPEQQLKMYISGMPVDSSVINILTSGGSKQSAEVEFIRWKTIGKEMNNTSKPEYTSNLQIDLDLSASPLLKLNVVLDELMGDMISGQGNGSLKIHTGTRDNLTMNGRFNIETGSYNFNFQDIFKKPFKLLGGGSSYISWNGDPYDAEININAVYLAEKVRMSTLFTDASNTTVSGISSDILREISDVEVRCNLTGTLSRPNPSFQLVIPQNSVVRNNATIDSKIKTINRDQLEVSKQATYLIVFKSFAPQAAIVATDLNNELLNTTISGVINGILSNSVQNFFSRVLGSSVDVNFNYTRTQTGITGLNGNTSGSGQSNFRENVSLQFIKSMLNDKLVITFGSDFNFATAGNTSLASGSQSFLFLPDVNVEYKITPDGKFRTSFFYRSSFDVLSTSGKRDRTGGNISFRTEFDNMFGRRRNKLTPPEKQ